MGSADGYRRSHSLGVPHSGSQVLVPEALTAGVVAASALAARAEPAESAFAAVRRRDKTTPTTASATTIGTTISSPGRHEFYGRNP